MNPEEGTLRPQIMDRFGLRVIVRGLPTKEERLEAYHRTRAYQQNPWGFAAHFAQETLALQEEIQDSRDALTDVELPDPVAEAGLELVERLEIGSLRAELTLFEAARAYTAADNRPQVTFQDLRAVAPMAIRLRRSRFIDEYLQGQQGENKMVEDILEEVLPTQDQESQE
jgi:magnesium chelatase subunit I